MKQSSSILFAFVLALAIVGLASVEAKTLCENVPTIQDCSLCCATKNFNRFDRLRYLTDNVCDCYVEQKEVDFNEKHRKRP